MNDFLWAYGLTLAAVCVLAGLFTYLRVVLKNKLLIAENKLRLKMQNFEANYRDIRDNPEGVVGGAIGDIGIEGILGELGVPKPFQGIAKGFIDGIMSDPKKMQALADKFGVKLPGSDKNGSSVDGML